MLRSRPARRAAALIIATVTIVALSGCTPSGYKGAAGTVAIQARRLGIPLSSTSVSCHPAPYDQMKHTCTAPVGPGGAKVVLDVSVGSVVTKTEKWEGVVVTIPANLARGALRRTEAGYHYVTQCSWRPNAKGVWAVDPKEGPRTFLVDADDQFVKEI